MTRKLQIIGHRGASAEAPENTLPAFERALELGADGIEMDVRLSRDGVPIVIHDSTFLRTGRDQRPVKEIAREAIRHIDAGRWFHEKFTGTEVPDLEMVIRRFLDRCVLKIELKCGGWRGSRILAETVAQVFRKTHLSPDQAAVSSFNHAVLYYIKRAAADFPRVVLFSSRANHWIARRPRLYKSVAASGYDIPWGDVGKTVSREQVNRWRNQGCRLAAWTVDEPELENDIITVGFDTVITNNPAAWV